MVAHFRHRLAEILRAFAAPTMAEPGVKLFLCYRSPTNKSLFFLFELFVDIWRQQSKTTGHGYQARTRALYSVSESLIREKRQYQAGINPILRSM